VDVQGAVDVQDDDVFHLEDAGRREDEVEAGFEAQRGGGVADPPPLLAGGDWQSVDDLQIHESKLPTAETQRTFGKS
jgi:hypothetical protein